MGETLVVSNNGIRPIVAELVLGLGLHVGELDVDCSTALFFYKYNVSMPGPSLAARSTFAWANALFSRWKRCARLRSFLTYEAIGHPQSDSGPYASAVEAHPVS